MRRTLLAFLILVCSIANAQTQKLTGRVVSPADPNGLPGVSVVIKGTTQGTVTDAGGRFTLEAAPGSTLVLSFVGYKTQELVYSGQADITVNLEENTQELGEIVVTGYTSTERKDITGSVATIKSTSFKDISLNGVDQALQGQAPGVQVTQSSGTPGGGISVHIRGATSISASNTPLYIVDGIQIQTGGLSDRSFGGQNDNALSLINPNDIESIVILKDASAKSLYGSRASNGVVIIKTKRGKNSKTKINFDVQRGIIDPVKKLKLLNSTQLVELQREAVTHAGQNPDSFGLIAGVTDGVNTNWQDKILRTGILQQYQLSATGGDDNTTFYISGSYRDEEGIQLNNKFQRLGLTLNLDQKLTEKLTLGTNLIISRGFNKRVKGDNFLDGVYSGAVKSLPYYSPYDENGALVGPGSPLYAAFPNFNPVAQALLPRFNILTLKILGGINATYQFNKNLMLKAQASLDYINSTEDQYESSQTAIGGYLPSVGGQGLGVFTASTSANVVSFATLSYNKIISEKHSVSGILGTELNQSYATSGSVQGRLFPSDDFTYVQSAGIVDNGFSSKTPPHNIISFFGEGKYDFENKVLLSLSLRADGSSNFGQNHKFGYFPTVSAAWRVSQEKFFHSQIISDLKLRASFGYTGNERIPAFSYLALWGAAPYNGGSGVVPNNTANPNVKWETTRESNVGVNLGVLNDRIQATVDVYYNKTFDLLLNKPYPLTTGFSGIFDNIGQMENKGIEVSVTSVNIDNALKWTTTFNISRNQNKILSLADTIPLYRGYTAAGVDGTNIIRKGEPLGSFWGLNFLGVNPATGNAIYQDLNKDGAITNADAMVIGNSQPKFFGGVTNRFQYKNFDLSVLFNFSVGNKILNFSKESLVNMGGDIQTNQSIDALRRWKKPGDVTDVPRYELNSTTNNLHSNRLLEDGSYLRLKNLSMGYNLPPKLTSRLMMGQVRIYVTATNLLTFTKYTGSDPEVSTLDGSTSAQGIDFFTLPQVRTISLGVNATLK
jgi:TonB-linked SusC/RagA family outer membrane protein